MEDDEEAMKEMLETDLISELGVIIRMPSTQLNLLRTAVWVLANIFKRAPFNQVCGLYEGR